MVREFFLLLMAGSLFIVGPAAAADAALTKQTEQGMYNAVLKPNVEPVPLREIHTWTLEVTDAEGKSFEPTELTVDGGMPGHGHGFPTDPQITEHLGDGAFLVDGVKFSMPGAWVMTFGITGPAGTDNVTFELELAP